MELRSRVRGDRTAIGFAVVVVVACGRGDAEPGASSGPAPTMQKVPVSASPDGAQPVEVTPAPAGVTTENLRAFFPQTYKGAPAKLLDDRMMGGPTQSGFAAAAYMLEDAAGARFVNINLQKVVDLGFEQAQFQVGEGETKEDEQTSMLGKSIDGRLVQRTYFKQGGSSEVIVLLREGILVRASVEKAADPDEAFEVLAALDLVGLEALVP